MVSDHSSGASNSSAAPECAAGEVSVWYDGACPLCRAEISFIRRLDRRGAIRFIDVASEKASCPIDRGELLRRFHAQEAGGPMLSGAAAFAAMWRAVPLLRPLGLLAQSPAALQAFEAAYLAFLRVRPVLQRLVRRRTACAEL